MAKDMMAAVVGLLLHGDLDYKGNPWDHGYCHRKLDGSTFSHKF